MSRQSAFRAPSEPVNQVVRALGLPVDRVQELTIEFRPFSLVKATVIMRQEDLDDVVEILKDYHLVENTPSDPCPDLDRWNDESPAL